MMFVWARAFVFAQLNNIDLIVSHWGQFKIGPILRKEKHRRLYFGYFRTPSPVNWLKKISILVAYDKIEEPKITEVPPVPGTLYVFNKSSRMADYFEGIREHRDEVREALLSMLAPHQREALSKLTSPVIGVHVRQGDFRKLAPGEEFGEYGHIRAPLSYFQSLIRGIRQIGGSDLPVTLFSDGSDSDLQELLKMPGVCLSENNSDIVDLILLSRSRIIVTSPSSTFSYWSGFLSDAPVLHHPRHFNTNMCSRANETFFEGSVVGSSDEWPSSLKDNIRAFSRQSGEMQYAAG
jgi:hypothetical protein